MGISLSRLLLACLAFRWLLGCWHRSLCELSLACSEGYLVDAVVLWGCGLVGAQGVLTANYMHAFHRRVSNVAEMHASPEISLATRKNAHEVNYGLFVFRGACTTTLTKLACLPSPAAPDLRTLHVTQVHSPSRRAALPWPSPQDANGVCQKLARRVEARVRNCGVRTYVTATRRKKAWDDYSACC